jgi:dGTPase
MKNRFYNDFDLDALGIERPRSDEYRSLFQVHRDRIIHTASFRRLQGKTQVFLTGEYDFYRTRLTHSLEVSQIGRSICAALRHRSPLLSPEFFIDPDLVEAACLAHDLGHPPFGHAGERSLHRLMADDGGFEGNAQTLRLLTETIFSHGTRGMNPSRALLDAVLKYKVLHRDQPDAANHFLYDDQERYLRFVGGDEAATPESGSVESLQSLECEIMDWADDTAYSLNDVADGVTAGFITIERLEQWAEQNNADAASSAHVVDLASAIREDRVETRANRKIGDFIAACSLAPRENSLSHRTCRHAFTLLIAPEALAEATLYKKIALDLVFRTPQLQQLDFKADQVVSRLYRALWENYVDGSADQRLRLLPTHVESALARSDTRVARARRLCDFLADQTDNAAARLCMRLFDPHFGGIADLM